ncbi:Protein of unknown function [Cotesia congregata]|uniref:Uncharacterized protein n=1 Tax=Cotesia congregata TaxID=51543 RepID=A0A8J2HLC3_COTCN|nr:Protein of unknown function [Cotesia congregata]
MILSLISISKWLDNNRILWNLKKNWTLKNYIENHGDKILLTTSNESYSGCAFNINRHCHWTQLAKEIFYNCHG